MGLDKRLLEILCCPVSKQPVLPLNARQLERLQRGHADTPLRFNDGSVIESRIDAGLLTRDGKTVYLVIDDIPVMLAEQAIATAQIEDFPAG